MRDDRVILDDLLEAISRIEKYAGEGHDRFVSDELVQTWVVHHLQIVGEAARKLSTDFKAQAAEVPWPQIIAMRNILIHDYFGVGLETVPTTVERDLPSLKQELLGQIIAKAWSRAGIKPHLMERYMARTPRSSTPRLPADVIDSSATRCCILRGRTWIRRVPSRAGWRDMVSNTARDFVALRVPGHQRRQCSESLRALRSTRSAS